MVFSVRGNELCMLELILLVSTEFGNSAPKLLQERHLLTARLGAFIIMTGSNRHAVFGKYNIFFSLAFV